MSNKIKKGEKILKGVKIHGHGTGTESFQKKVWLAGRLSNRELPKIRSFLFLLVCFRSHILLIKHSFPFLQRHMRLKKDLKRVEGLLALLHAGQL